MERMDVGFRLKWSYLYCNWEPIRAACPGRSTPGLCGRCHPARPLQDSCVRHPSSRVYGPPHPRPDLPPCPDCRQWHQRWMFRRGGPERSCPASCPTRWFGLNGGPHPAPPRSSAWADATPRRCCKAYRATSGGCWSAVRTRAMWPASSGTSFRRCSVGFRWDRRRRDRPAAVPGGTGGSIRHYAIGTATAPSSGSRGRRAHPSDRRGRNARGFAAWRPVYPPGGCLSCPSRTRKSSSRTAPSLHSK